MAEFHRIDEAREDIAIRESERESQLIRLQYIVTELLLKNERLRCNAPFNCGFCGSNRPQHDR